MINGILWFVVGGLIGAVISLIMEQGVKPYVFLDIFAGSGGAFAAGMFLALFFGIHSITPHHLNVPILAASSVGALFSIALVNLLVDATHSQGH